MMEKRRGTSEHLCAATQAGRWRRSDTMPDAVGGERGHGAG